MNYLLALVLVAAALAANAYEHGEGLDNPIIEFFEAPVRAFKTKVAEDVEPVSNSAPEGKSVGVGKTPNNSWFRGKGLASWLMSRNAVTTTTTTTPEVVLNTPVGSTQQIQTNNSPNRRRLVRRQNVRRQNNGGQYAANNNWNMRRNASPNRRRVNRRPIEDDVYSDEDDYDEYGGGRHYQLTYDRVPYQSVSYEDEEYDNPLSYMPIKPHKLRRGYSDQKKNVKPNSSFLQPFQDMPVQARPVRLRQNLPATKPIGSKQQGQQPNRKPASNPNRKPANANNNNKNKKKKKKNKNKPNNANNVNKVQQDPVHFIVHPQGNGQLPVLIPVNKNKKNPGQNVMSDQMDYQNYQYIPIPIQAFNQAGGFKGIPQIQVIAQHTHTFRPHHGFPTEVILGPGGYDPGYGGQNDMAEAPTHKKKNKHKGEMSPMITQNQKIVLDDEEPMKNETPMSAIIEEHMLEPTKQTIVVEEIMKPETTLATQTAGMDELMEVTAGGEEKLSGTEVRSVDGRQHIVVPRHIFPIFGASSLVEVANNGRFLLKTGRDLKVDEPVILNESIAEIKEKQPLDEKEPVKEEPLKESVTEDDKPKPNPEHSIKKKEEAPADEKPVPPVSKTELVQPSENLKPLATEKVLSHLIPVRPEQLQDIPVAIVQDESLVKEVSHSEKTGRSVHHGAHKPFLRSEIVHEKPNGHFIVKSGVAPSVESRSRVHNSEVKENDSEIQTIKITPIENSRAL